MKHLLLTLPCLLLLPCVASCGPGSGTYCQSGAKMGTECHALSDVTDPPGRRPPPVEANHNPEAWWTGKPKPSSPPALIPITPGSASAAPSGSATP
jgi:hypothetical protein